MYLILNILRTICLTGLQFWRLVKWQKKKKSIQSRKSCRKYKSENGRIQASEYIRGALWKADNHYWYWGRRSRVKLDIWMFWPVNILKTLSLTDIKLFTLHILRIYAIIGFWSMHWNSRIKVDIRKYWPLNILIILCLLDTKYCTLVYRN
jgi:hypothetical protein